MTETKIKLVVVNNHTLGYIQPESPNIIGILHASTLRGAIGTNQHPAPISIFNQTIRLASEIDFNEFRVSFKGFENKEVYEYKSIN